MKHAALLRAGRVRTGLVRAALACLLSLLPARSAVAQEPGEPRCGWCSTTGRLEVELDRKFELERESGPAWKVRFCSEAVSDETLALDWQPCGRCKTPSLQAKAQAEWNAIKTAGDEWLAEQRKIDKVAQVKKPLMIVETTHIRVVWDTAKIVGANKKSYNAHEAAHLYARRLEELHARYQTMFGVNDSQNLKNLHTFMIFENPTQAHLAAPPYTGLQGLPTVKRSGGSTQESVVVTWWDKSVFSKDQDMYREQTHHLIHQLTSVYYDIRWFPPGKLGLLPPWLHDKYGWMDEGLAHWFEIDMHGRAGTYCTREQDTTDRWGGDDWRKNIYKAVMGGDVPSFPEVIPKATNSLTNKERQFSWSWCDYLLRRDPEGKGALAMGQAMKMCKLEAPVRDILRDAFGLTMLGFEEGWRAWVLETYAPTNKAR
ncbi:MAG: hypothetical protein ACT4PU_12550 [Planctomycetota bacterium]